VAEEEEQAKQEAKRQAIEAWELDYDKRSAQAEMEQAKSYCALTYNHGSALCRKYPQFVASTGKLWH